MAIAPQIREDHVIYQRIAASTNLTGLLGTGVARRVYNLIMPSRDHFPCVVYVLDASEPLGNKDDQLSEGDYNVSLMVLEKGNQEGNYENFRSIIDELKNLFNVPIDHDPTKYNNTILDQSVFNGERDEVKDLEGTIIRCRTLSYTLSLRLEVA